MTKIKINDKNIGNQYPCFTIAEAGANHDGEISKALKLIDAAIEGNADSVKFQTYKASKLTTKTGIGIMAGVGGGAAGYAVAKKKKNKRG